MAYLGQSNSLYDPTRVTPTTVQTFNGDGVTTQFTLQYSVLQSIDIEVLVENVFQQPDYAYTAVGNLITFSSAPPVGSGNIYVRFGKVTGLTGTVPDGSITSSKLANNIRLLATDMYTANGVATQWTLSDTPADANSLIVTVNGVGQAAPRNYTVSGSTITFTDPPNNGANVVIRNVGFRTTQTLFAFPSGTQMVQPVITGGSANNMTLTNVSITGTANNVTLTNPTINGFTGDTSVVNIGSGQIYKDTSGNVGIGTSSPVTKLQVSATGSTPVSFERTGSNGVYLQLKDASGSSVFLGASNGTFAIQTPGSSYSDKLLIDSSGNLGIGVTPKNSYGPLRSMEIGPSSSALFGGFASSTNLQTWVSNNTYSDGVADRYAVTGSPASMFRCANGTFDWRSTGTTTGTAGGTSTLNTFMTLDASGNLTVGPTPGAAKFTVTSTTASIYSGYFQFVNTGYGIGIANTSGGSAALMYFFSPNYVGQITTNGTTTSYTSASDQRLKENIIDAPEALTSINSIKVRSFDWKSDGSHVDFGYIAQELIGIVPEVVSEPTDPDEMMGVDFGKLTPRLVKAIQELSAKVDAQQEEINQLKGVN